MIPITTNRVLVNVSASDWAAHFIGPCGQVRIGPWLLHHSAEEVETLLAWGKVSPEALEEHRTNIRRGGTSSVVWQLSNRQVAQLIERGEGWPWNGYELRKMKKAGDYPPRRLAYRSSLTGGIMSGFGR
ncbi:hypothetical protein HDF16_004965 [Granulicella aggregans]|uniref:Uncharacterized protein n=1 Tax=Granulicella aggregans TaxID=474949 RepID=A0A7W8E6E4_9BACT|nr:hypothetical protein [Granulicella aggregans]MBB5060229.1 hypothetical protein [Granulicella aggregans]